LFFSSLARHRRRRRRRRHDYNSFSSPFVFFFNFFFFFIFSAFQNDEFLKIFLPFVARDETKHEMINNDVEV